MKVPSFKETTATNKALVVLIAAVLLAVAFTSIRSNGPVASTPLSTPAFCSSYNTINLTTGLAANAAKLDALAKAAPSKDAAMIVRDLAQEVRATNHPTSASKRLLLKLDRLAAGSSMLKACSGYQTMQYYASSVASDAQAIELASNLTGPTTQVVKTALAQVSAVGANPHLTLTPAGKSWTLRAPRSTTPVCVTFARPLLTTKVVYGACQ